MTSCAGTTRSRYAKEWLAVLSRNVHVEVIALFLDGPPITQPADGVVGLVQNSALNKETR